MTANSPHRRRLRHTGRCRLYVPPAVIVVALGAGILVCVYARKDKPTSRPEARDSPRTCPTTQTTGPAATQPSSQTDPVIPAPSALDQLDPTKLAEALRKRGMTALLIALAEALNHGTRELTVDALGAIVQAKISQAQQPDVSEERRNKLLEEAAEILETIVKRTRNAKGPKAVMEHFRFRRQLAELYGIVQAEPRALRMLFLQDGPEDRRIVREKAGKACELLDQLDKDVEAAIQEGRLERRLVVSAIPQLEDLRKQMQYKRAWVCFYRGMSLPDTPEHRKERRERLQWAIQAVKEWADGDPASGVKYWSLLLRGMAYRELKQFKLARDSLQRAATDQKEGAENVIRVRAYFEIARTAIESGDFKGAEVAIRDFRSKVTRMYGEQGQYGVDLYAALLWDYSYRRQAKLAADAPKSAAALREKAVLALLKVPAKHSDWAEQAHWAGVIRGKYGADAEDNPAVLYAAAVGLLEKWRELRDKKADVPKGLKDDALRKLDKLLDAGAADHQAARKLARPLALRRKAWIRAADGRAPGGGRREERPAQRALR